MGRDSRTSLIVSSLAIDRKTPDDVLQETDDETGTGMSVLSSITEDSHYSSAIIPDTRIGGHTPLLPIIMSLNKLSLRSILGGVGS
jgi:hypothetical protein